MEQDKTIPQSPQVATQNGPVHITSHLPEQTPPPKESASFLSTLAIIASAIIVAVSLTVYVFQSYQVDGPSMQPTLANRDRLLVLKLPKTIADITNRDYIPNRGDIVIFSTTALQEGPSDAGEKQLIKRVIGLPGDRVVVRNGEITVYNSTYPEGYNPDKTGDYQEGAQVTPGDVDIVVNKGEVFVVGDNRTNSLDSRTIGTVPAEDLIGKLIFRIFPIDKTRAF